MWEFSVAAFKRTWVTAKHWNLWGFWGLILLALFPEAIVSQVSRKYFFIFHIDMGIKFQDFTFCQPKISVLQVTIGKRKTTVSYMKEVSYSMKMSTWAMPCRIICRYLTITYSRYRPRDSLGQAKGLNLSPIPGLRFVSCSYFFFFFF